MSEYFRNSWECGYWTSTSPLTLRTRTVFNDNSSQTASNTDPTAGVMVLIVLSWSTSCLLTTNCRYIAVFSTSSNSSTAGFRNDAKYPGTNSFVPRNNAAFSSLNRS